MTVLPGFVFHRLLTTPIPSLSEDDSPVAAGAEAALFAALTAAHAELLSAAADAVLAVAWDRSAGEHRLRFLVGGYPRFPPVLAGTGDVAVMYPPGSTARAAPSVARDWARVPVWLRCGGRSDALSVQDAQAGSPGGRGCFEDYVAHLPGEFVWLTIARPLPPAAVDTELADLEVRLPRLRARENSEPDRIALQRGEFRYRELAGARAAGMWSVHVLVGGPDEPSTRQAAGLLCSAADLDALPYVLQPHARTGSLAEIWAAAAEPAEFGSPFVASGELLAALARPPRRELPGIRAVERVRFDLTPEHDGQVDLGAILDDADQRVDRFRVGLDTLNRHSFVAGATGSGKSQTVRHLLEGLHGAGVPWLVIEPAKAEYAGMAGRIRAPVTVIRPGDPAAVPVGLNPLEPEAGFPLQTHIDLVRALFLAAFDAVEPFPQVLSHALTRCYTDLGWDTVVSAARNTDATPRYPSLTELQAAASTVVDGIGYGREITDNVRGFIDVRLSALRLGTPGRFFEGGYRLDVADLLRRNVVLEIEDIGNDADKAFFIGAVLIRVFEHLRVHRGDNDSGLCHVTVVEEAHRLLRRAEPGTPAAHAVELFAALLAEVRAYGEGIIVAEQIPTKITPDVVKNTALKILHRLPAAEDRELVGATMNLAPAQSRHVVALPTGHGVVFGDGMDRPVRVAVPLGRHREARCPAPTIALSPAPAEPPLLLRDLHRAHRIADDPPLTLWMELMLLAHLVGRPPPTPDPGWLAALRRAHPRPLLTEAVGFRVRTGVDARYPGLSDYFRPELLSEHLTAAALATLDGDHSPCARHADSTGADPGVQCSADETCWQAGPYRWADVERALADPELAPDRPHPDTAAWAERGLVLTGTTPREQLRELHTHPDTWADRAIVTGPEIPTLLAATIARLSHAPTAARRLRAATAHLRLSTPWPLALLDEPTDAAPRDTP
ncbi:DNA helicase HerA-like ATPase [Nocardia tenerifensis]|uniref:DNA helicase HerA-like ATPase n=1 Tax=Nocardia tenerifensis TaxID=228006 RepID=A0A318K9U3_9NOCA|nr:ATP-binding protein [Nocardia tenerifensis]PXX71331.1 DNA helicase HerA-like ATPase [Nocardia tenerifensis]